jgi:hypothetical protein
MPANPNGRLASAREALAHVSQQTALLAQFASMFGRMLPDQHDELVAQFHNLAGRLPYVEDSDYGALLLEATADALQDSSLARRLYREAFYRARWCVQAATAGGEMIARSSDLSRIESKFRTQNDRIQTAHPK